MLGFISFSGAPISSVGSSVIFSQTINIVGEAFFNANANANWSGSSSIVGEAFFNVNANANWNGSSSITGEAYTEVFGEIAGSGWTRINPDSTEWDYQQSSDWNKIK